jgi:hypothetical protein
MREFLGMELEVSRTIHAGGSNYFQTSFIQIWGFMEEMHYNGFLEVELLDKVLKRQLETSFYIINPDGSRRDYKRMITTLRYDKLEIEESVFDPETGYYKRTGKTIVEATSIKEVDAVIREKIRSFEKAARKEFPIK